MPEDVTARHRSGGVGRLLTLRSATPRHAAPVAVPAGPATHAMPAPGRRYWPWALALLAVLPLAAAVPLALLNGDEPQATVPLPTVSIPQLPTETDPAPASTAARRQLRGIRQAAKAGAAPSASPSASVLVPVRTSATAAPVLLGPGSADGLPPLLNSYCRATYGQFTRATLTGGDWACSPFGRAPVALDMTAMCRFSYGDGARAVLGSASDPGSWRCYR